VDRNRRRAVAGTAREIIDRLRAGDNMVLFAEGTSSDGNQVLPFRTALFASAKPSGEDAAALEEGIFVQTLAIAYTRVHGIPLGRLSRPRIAWYGDMNLASHAWDVLKMGPLDVHVRLGDPVPLAKFVDRKALARFTEKRVRADVAALLHPHSPSSALTSHPVDDVLDWG
jgi:1-acyl-sn-glycerol-3-phosphate acyltransferase